MNDSCRSKVINYLRNHRKNIGEANDFESIKATLEVNFKHFAEIDHDNPEGNAYSN